jgi:hypothetical protein
MSQTPSTRSISLVPATPEAAASIGHRPEIRITTFPFKVGREGRMRVNQPKGDVERRVGGAAPLNDLFLLEPAAPVLNISREHFLIERIGDRFALVDRNSVCGTVVAGRALGGEARESRAELHDGDLIVVGGHRSPYVFKFRVL